MEGGLNQILGLSWLYLYTAFKPKTWLRPFCEYHPWFVCDGKSDLQLIS